MSQGRMMFLTGKDRWKYDAAWSSRSAIDLVKKRDEWVSIARRLLPDGPLRFLELGCAPGLYTAALSEGTSWDVSGIDYSDNSDLFIEALRVVGKNATLHRMDMFSNRVPGEFDIVCSFGLVEHFRGESLDNVLRLHASYVADGGYVVIEMPNFTGFQYFWHYIFDRPDLDNHNVDVMQPAAMSWFANNGFEVIFNDYVGAMRLWGNSGWTHIRIIGKVVAGTAVVLSKIARMLDRIGLRMRGRSWSPDFLMVVRRLPR